MKCRTWFVFSQIFMTSNTKLCSLWPFFIFFLMFFPLDVRKHIFPIFILLYLRLNIKLYNFFFLNALFSGTKLSKCRNYYFALKDRVPHISSCPDQTYRSKFPECFPSPFFSSALKLQDRKTATFLLNISLKICIFTCYFCHTFNLK